MRFNYFHRQLTNQILQYQFPRSSSIFLVSWQRNSTSLRIQIRINISVMMCDYYKSSITFCLNSWIYRTVPVSISPFALTTSVRACVCVPFPRTPVPPFHNHDYGFMVRTWFKVPPASFKIVCRFLGINYIIRPIPPNTIHTGGGTPIVI